MGLFKKRMEQSMEQLKTIKDISEYLNVKERTIYSWINKGTIPHIKLTNKVIRFNLNTINEWLENRCI